MSRGDVIVHGLAICLLHSGRAQRRVGVTLIKRKGIGAIRIAQRRHRWGDRHCSGPSGGEIEDLNTVRRGQRGSRDKGLGDFRSGLRAISPDIASFHLIGRHARGDDTRGVGGQNEGERDEDERGPVAEGAAVGYTRMLQK